MFEMISQRFAKPVTSDQIVLRTKQLFLRETFDSKIIQQSDEDHLLTLFNFKK